MMNDVDAFGHWLSGFVDGEGCFTLTVHRTKGKEKLFETPSGRFEILLRGDDSDIIHKIKNYWGVGNIGERKLSSGNPAARYYVGNIPDLVRVVIPHFERYPLRAKKARDFPVWRQGILLVYEVHCRPRVIRQKHNGGMVPKWAPEEREEFNRLTLLLRQGKEFIPRQ